MTMENLKIKLGQSGRRLNFGALLAVSVFVLVFASGLAITQTANAALPCDGEYASCNLDYGGVKKGICLAGFCGSTDISLNLKSKYNATKTYCADSATKNECITPTVKPEINGYGDLIGFSCNAKEVNTSCAVSTCAQNPLGTPYSGCTNAAEKCQFYAGSVYYPTYPSCVANTACPDADRDGIPLCWAPGQYTKWDTPVPPPKKDPSRFSDDSGIGDCNDKDPYSYGYSSANIASVSFAPINRNYPVGNFSPLDGVSLTVNFKKKCGHTTPTPPGVPLHVSLVFSPTQEFTLSGSSPITFARKSDFVYTADIGFNSYLTEELIAAIVKNPKPKLKFLGVDEFTRSDKPFNNPILPMTNCAQVYGSGRHKVVYMRSYDPGTSLQGYLALANVSIYSGFNVIEPFKKYQNELSHYIDLKAQSLPGVLLSKSAILSQLEYDANIVKKASSCGSKSSLYVLFDRGDYTSPRAAGFKNKVVIMDGEFIDEEEYAVDVGPIVVHEAGHAFAGLLDEYLYPNARSRFPLMIPYFLMLVDSGNNCSTKPWIQYSHLSRVYGRTDSTPCTLDELFKPSANSLMGDYRRNEKQFNVVSCGYILKAIKKGGTAKSYFPECAAIPGII